MWAEQSGSRFHRTELFQRWTLVEDESVDVPEFYYSRILVSMHMSFVIHSLPMIPQDRHSQDQEGYKSYPDRANATIM